MAAITWNDVTNIASSLPTVPVDKQDAILAYVNQALAVHEWGGEASQLLKLARIYLAAHIVTADPAADGAPVGSKSEGGVSVGYVISSPVGTDPIYDKTVWGREFRRLCRISPARAPRII